MYPIELDIKNIRDTDRSDSYLDLDIDSKGQLKANLYHEREDFNFPILNFPLTYAATFQWHLHVKYISLG